MKKTIVFLGADNTLSQPEFRASAALLKVNGILHLLTAKHVVAEVKDGKFTGRLVDEALVAYFNKKDGTIGRRAIAHLKKSQSIEWVFHPDVNVDIALLPFGVDVENDDVLSIPDSYLLGIDALSELMDVFFMSFQPGIGKTDQVRPVYRPGTVAIILPNKTFYIDGAAFPGNSGSPVFVRPQPVGFAKTDAPVFPAPNSGHFIGVIGEYLPYREVAISSQTGRPRVVFEEHTGLSRVWSTDLVVELINTSQCQNQILHLKANARQKTQ
ncbi:MAG TPA: serine protease [Syntrophales bacterium]|nr:serine protease [Syntrophales bacterium]